MEYGDNGTEVTLVGDDMYQRNYSRGNLTSSNFPVEILMAIKSHVREFVATTLIYREEPVLLLGGSMPDPFEIYLR